MGDLQFGEGRKIGHGGTHAPLPKQARGQRSKTLSDWRPPAARARDTPTPYSPGDRGGMQETIFVVYRHPTTFRMVSDAVYLPKYVELYNKGLLDFQINKTERPAHHPDPATFKT